LAELNEVRNMIIKETIETEESYVQSLQAVQEVNTKKFFNKKYEELMKGKALLTPKEHQIIFGNSNFFNIF
jgi:hypothetical protein